MYQKIAERLTELQNGMPENPQFAEWIEQSNMWSWVYSMFRISAVSISRSCVVDMLAGNVRENVSLRAHAFAQDCRRIYGEMRNFCDKKKPVDIGMIEHWAAVFANSGKDIRSEDLYRTNNPIIYEWGIIPEHFSSLQVDLEIMLKWYSLDTDPANPIRDAVRLHLELNKMYPFGANTFFVSMALLMYSLMLLGIPLPELEADDVIYNHLMTDYISDGNEGPFLEMLEKSILNRLDSIIDLEKQAAEASRG